MSSSSSNRYLLILIPILLLVGFLGQPATTIGQPGKGAPSDEEVARLLGLSLEQVRQLQTQRGMTNEMLAAFPPRRVPDLLRKLERGNIQQQREDHAALFLRNEKGIIPADQPLRTIEHLGAIRKNLKPGLRVAGLPSGPRVESLLPRTAGLKPDHTGWDALGPHQVGGRTRALVVHPKIPDIMYAGSTGGGIWRTKNGGDTWEPLSDFLAHMVVSCIVMDPINPKILYVGTGEGFGGAGAFRGGGIYKTADGGDTWAALPITLDKKEDKEIDKKKEEEKYSSFHYVNRLAISPDGKTLLAAVGQGNDREVAPDDGIYLSSDPDRAEWHHVLNAHIGCVHFDPNDNNKAIAGSLERTPSDGGAAYFSVTGGLKWDQAPKSKYWQGRVELAYAKADSKVVYATTRRQRDEVWRSPDGGETYHLQATKTAKGERVNFLGGQGWYNNVVWAGDPDRSDLVIVGGVDLWRSTNCGQTLEPISLWSEAPASAHGDQHVIVSHPHFKKNRTVFVGNDGGIYRADDIYTAGGGKTFSEGWTHLSSSYTVTQFYGVAAHAKTGMILGGAQDNASHLYRDQKWSKVGEGDGGFCAIDPDDPRYYYFESQNLRLGRSETSAKEGYEVFELCGFRRWKTDDGRWWGEWLPEPYHIPDVMLHNPKKGIYRVNFIAPFILDPNDPRRLLAGGASLWLTEDARAPLSRHKGPKWREIKLPDKENTTNFISAIAVASGASDVIWVGHNNGDIFRTNNGKEARPEWKPVTASDFPKGRTCARITIDPKNSERVFVTFAGYGGRSVWKTENNGKKWTDVSISLPPELPCYSLAIHPRNPDFLYLGTQVGVFASDDGGQKWSPTNEGPTNCRVDDLTWMGEILVAASHGRGIHRIDLSKAMK